MSPIAAGLACVMALAVAAPARGVPPRARAATPATVDTCLALQSLPSRVSCLRAAGAPGAVAIVGLVAELPAKDVRLADGYLRDVAGRAFSAEAVGKSAEAAALERAPEEARDEHQRAVALRALGFLVRRRAEAQTAGSWGVNSKVAAPAVEAPRPCAAHAGDAADAVALEALDCLAQAQAGWPAETLVEVALARAAPLRSRASRILERYQTLDEALARRLATRLLSSHDGDEQAALCAILERTTPAGAAWVAYAALATEPPANRSLARACLRLQDRDVAGETPGAGFGICQTIPYPDYGFQRLCVQDAAVYERGRITVEQSPFGTGPADPLVTIVPPRLRGEHVDVAGVRFADIADAAAPGPAWAHGLLVIPLLLGPLDAPVARRLLVYTIAGTWERRVWQSPPCRSPGCREDLLVRRDPVTRALLGLVFLGGPRPVALSYDEVRRGTLTERLGCDPLFGALEDCRGEKSP